LYEHTVDEHIEQITKHGLYETSTSTVIVDESEPGVITTPPVVEEDPILGGDATSEVIVHSPVVSNEIPHIEAFGKEMKQSPVFHFFTPEFIQYWSPEFISWHREKFGCHPKDRGASMPKSWEIRSSFTWKEPAFPWYIEQHRRLLYGRLEEELPDLEEDN
jgi:hypothetical protein